MLGILTNVDGDCAGSDSMNVSSEVYYENKRFLWGVCYRMTGNAADAEDLVQETFVKALEKPPRNTEDAWRPWLLRVAINLSRNQLRRRRQRGYEGAWLPSPVPTDDVEVLVAQGSDCPPEDSPSARYEMLESISVAFLLALEALTPSQRAVLLLRDVLDYSTKETAEALLITETGAKVILHRARRIMRDYDKDRCALSPSRCDAAKHALERFLNCLSTRTLFELSEHAKPKGPGRTANRRYRGNRRRWRRSQRIAFSNAGSASSSAVCHEME